MSKQEKKPAATLLLLVHYEEIPSDHEIEDLLDKARELGGIRQADFSVVAPVTRSLV